MTNRIRDILERAVKTFIFAFAAAFVLPAATEVSDWHSWYAALVAAVATGIGAVVNIGLTSFGPNKETASLLKQE